VPDANLVNWLGRQDDRMLFLASVVLGEIWRGITVLNDGRKKRDLIRWFTGHTGPSQVFAGRLLVFDDAAALQWGEFMAHGLRAGRPRSIVDMEIAAIAKVNGCALVTLNSADFVDLADQLSIIDPTAAGEAD
jgi:toxin FitB